MKGNNTLELNHATMVQALQLWADATFKTPVKVQAVHETTARQANVFEVELTEPPGKMESSTGM